MPNTRARESWLAGDDHDRVADAMLLCQMASATCAQDGRCALDGFCFRGLGSAEVRRGIERRLDAIEREMRELRAAIPRGSEAKVYDLVARLERERSLVTEAKPRA